MRNKRRFAVAVQLAFVATPATAEVRTWCLFHYDVDSVPPLRQPRPGEHLGDYLIAEHLPSHSSAGSTEGLVRLLPTFNNVGPPGAVPPLPTAADSGGRTSIRFENPAGMKVSWQASDRSFHASVTAPKEYNFARGQTYRLRLTRVSEDYLNEAFYPTIEVAPATPKTKTFLAHSSVPVTFTPDDFAQAKAGRLVVKVLYLPDPVEQDFSTVVSTEEVVSTQLEPGVDPVKEAERRGTILAVIRLGNVDLQERSRPRSEQR